MDVERPLYIFALASTLLLSACANGNSGSPESKNQKATPECASSAIPSRYIVRWKDGSHSVVDAANDEALIRDVIAPNNDDIAFTEPNYRISLPRKPAAESTDGTVSAQAQSTTTVWTWGQESIGATSAWTLASGEGVIVAVVDSGADTLHAQLHNQIAVNTAELNGATGVDDDANGYIDDIYGFDFRTKTGNIHDGATGHGTHVSGIIAGEHQAGSPMTGVAPAAKILPLNFMDDNGSGEIGNALFAIDYAVSRGAKVINASWGSSSCSLDLQLKIEELEAKGVLFVAAAGNGDRNGIGQNLDEHASFPAAYDIPGLITVGAIYSSNRMTGFSNYSRKLVHLVAPGGSILSTFPTANDHKECLSTDPAGYCTMDGTSMATPFVSGAAAVLWSYRPHATVAQIKQALMASVDNGDYPVMSAGRLDLRKALDQLAALIP